MQPPNYQQQLIIPNYDLPYTHLGRRIDRAAQLMAYFSIATSLIMMVASLCYVLITWLVFLGIASGGILFGASIMLSQALFDIDKCTPRFIRGFIISLSFSFTAIIIGCIVMFLEIGLDRNGEAVAQLMAAQGGLPFYLISVAHHAWFLHIAVRLRRFVANRGNVSAIGQDGVVISTGSQPSAYLQ